MRVDERRKGGSFLAINTTARTIVGRGQNSLLSAPGSELRLGRKKEKEKCQDTRRDEQKNKAGGLHSAQSGPTKRTPLVWDI